ncbi:ABC transporter ATP-binding protein [Ferruginivarius sediminum]|uniref:ABC transporter ATP-binding protein n=1 Tax=Ferruginivarius sediminum TaxID=2661937 RepID=A0A369TGU2_9PROT|nr:ABC transporter ATP-binding protein [Ferruginivarius sediminum]RDD63834.1 ABC transporter ATP-binding protein [Ferruginivarius sediminum]
MPLLEVDGLRTYFRTPAGLAKAVDDVSLDVEEGEIRAIVGESGCGKSVLSLSILRLLPQPPAFHAGGEIRFGGRDLLKVSQSEIRHIRGNEISMIFQEPMSALNPVFTIGHQLTEVYRVHRGVDARSARRQAVEMLTLVGVPAPEARLREYPFQLSGGMRQRVMIAMALACRPKLLIADEPTTALDVTIQAQILDLMRDLRESLGTAIILITHDLGVVAEMADRVSVMYAGRVAESAEVEALFDRTLHPYTRGLMHAVPSMAGDRAQSRLTEIGGVVPNLTDLPEGCRFEPRCPLAVAYCRKKEPPLETYEGAHMAACWRAGDA